MLRGIIFHIFERSALNNFLQLCIRQLHINKFGDFANFLLNVLKTSTNKSRKMHGIMPIMSDIFRVRLTKVGDLIQ